MGDNQQAWLDWICDQLLELCIMSRRSLVCWFMRRVRVNGICNHRTLFESLAGVMAVGLFDRLCLIFGGGDDLFGDLL